MTQFVELDRQFSQLGDEVRVDAEFLAYIERLSGSFGWEALLERKRVVVLAEAQAGKTSELEAAAGRLRKTGKAAFFVRLDAIAETDLTRALGEDADAFEVWRKGTEQGWLFLDARDETTLSGKSFRMALANLRAALGPALVRAHVIVSSRVSDWQPQADRAELEKMLAPPPQRTEVPDAAAGADGDALLGPVRRARERKSKQKEDAESDARALIVAMVPLDRDRIARLARAWGVQDTEPFMRALEDADAINLASRPGNLAGLVIAWRKRGEFGTYERVLRLSIDKQLSDLRNIPGAKVQLEPEKYWAGARRVAAAMTLAGSEALSVRDAERDLLAEESTVDPYRLFPDWNPESVDAVLRTSLFDPHSYGRIRFHERAIREYLAAEWILKLKQTAGLSGRELHDLLFAERHGERVVLPAMRPVAPWIALQEPYIRDELLERDPEALLTYGDPTQLPLEVKRKLLKRTVHVATEGRAEPSEYDTRVLRSFADAGLAADIRKYWNEAAKSGGESSQDVMVLLLRLIRAGRIEACADLVREAALRQHPRDLIQRLAISAAVAIGRSSDLSRIVRYLVARAKSLSANVLRDALEVLFPAHLTAQQALMLIDVLATAAPDEYHGPRYVLERMATAADSAQARMALFTGLAQRTGVRQTDPSDWTLEQDERWPAKWRHLGPGFMNVAERVIREDRPVALPDDAALVVAQACELISEAVDTREENESVRVALAEWRGRAWMFRLLAEQFERWVPKEYVKSADSRALYIDGVMRFRGQDFKWLLDPHAATQQELALRSALTAWAREGRSDAQLGSIRAFAAHDPALAAIVDEAARPPAESDWHRRRRSEQEKRARERKAAHEAEERSWRAFEQKLRANPGVLTTPGQGASDEHFTNLWWLRTWMELRHTGDPNIYSIANWQDLKDGFGEDVTNAAATAFKAYWRELSVKLPSEFAPAERHTVQYSTMVGLTGLAIEAASDELWTSRLTDGEVDAAVRLGLRELNGFPEWMPALAQSHPNVVYPLLLKEVRAELEEADPKEHPQILQSLRHARPGDWPELATRLVPVLRAARKVSVKALGYVVDILIATGTVDLPVLADLAQENLRDSSLGEEAWLRFASLLLASDASKAARHMRTWINAAPKAQRRGRAERLLAVLGDEDRSLLVRVPNGVRVQALEQLIRVGYEYVRPEDDARHHGVYSPDVRDKAQDARAWLVRELAATPGAETHAALMRLAKWPRSGLAADWMLSKARERAELDSVQMWDGPAVAEFETSRGKRPANGDELMRLTVRRLEEIADHLAGSDFSQAELLRKAALRQERALRERDLQLWIADRLELLRRGYYTVTREEEVIHKKKPDIRIHSSEANAKVSVEIKVADDWSGAELRRALGEQLIGQYQRDSACRHGVLVLIGRGRRRFWTLGKKRISSLEALAAVLRREAAKPRRERGVELYADVVDIAL